MPLNEVTESPRQGRKRNQKKVEEPLVEMVFQKEESQGSFDLGGSSFKAINEEYDVDIKAEA